MTDHIQTNEMDCRDIAAVLSGLIDGELDDATRHLADRHVASCRTCAARIDEVERLNDQVGLSVAVVDGLPDGMMNAVFAQTTRAGAIPIRPKRWVSWTGWVAAAAMFMLACTMFYFEWFDSRTATPEQGGPVAIHRDHETTRSAAANETRTSRTVQQNAVIVPYPIGPELRSAATGGYLPKAAQRDVEIREPGGELAARSGAGGANDGAVIAPWPLPGSHRVMSDALLESRAETDSAAHGDTSLARYGRHILSRDDEDTLYAASNVLDMLIAFEVDNMRVADHMRDIIVYDELLPRLESTRRNLLPEHRPTMLAAEALLYRVVHGPVNADDLIEMRRAAEELELVDHLNRLVGYTDPKRTM